MTAVNPRTPHMPQRPRGFIVLAVAVGIVVLGLAAIAQFDVVKEETVTAIRSEQEARARAVAESCLARGYAYAQANQADLDTLLAPKGAPTFILDVKGEVVQVPSAKADDPLRRYRAFAMDGGACYLRYDDNYDEGDTANNWLDDKDGLIFVTAIGVFPLFGINGKTGVAADSYERASAKVSLRRPVAQVGAGATGVAVHAGDKAIMEGDTQVCGAGGLQADDLKDKDNGGCVCGMVAGEGTTPKECSNCPSSCLSQSHDDKSKDQVDPVIDLPPKPVWRNTNQSDLGDPGVCNFWMDKNRVYLWDYEEPGCGTWTGLAPEPCSWKTSSPYTSTCINDQSRCWKPVAGIGTSSPPTALTTHTLRISISTSNSSSSGNYYFAPNPSQPISQHYMAKGSSPMWPTFCGDGAWQGCADCGKKPSFTSRSSGEHRIKDPLTAQTFLFPSRIFSSGTQGLRFDGGSDVGKPSAPVALSLFSEGDMKVAAPMYVCCAECDCSGVDLGTCTKGSYDGPSYAIRSGGSCDMSYESDIAPFEFGAVGRITCDDEVEFKDSSCIIGALTNYADGENSLVVWEDSRVFGNITSRGSIEVRDGSRVRGVIQGEQDVDFGPNGYLEGSIKAGDDATVYSDSTVVYSGSGGSGGGSGAFSAGNWFDLGW